MKRAVLLAASGTANEQARATLDIVTREVQAAGFGDVAWTYTSGSIVSKCQARGIDIQLPGEALTRLAQAGFEEVAVLSLHLVAGQEHEHLRDAAVSAAARGLFRQLRVGPPLLASGAALESTVSAVCAALPAERAPADAVVLMGHGNEAHSGSLAYLAAAAAFRRRDPAILLGVLEGQPDVSELLRECQERAGRRVWLLPFTLVAGFHALADLAGPRPTSWLSQFQAHGFDCRPVMQGLVENAAIRAMYLAHLRELMAGFAPAGSGV